MVQTPLCALLLAVFSFFFSFCPIPPIFQGVLREEKTTKTKQKKPQKRRENNRKINSKNQK